MELSEKWDSHRNRHVAERTTPPEKWSNEKIQFLYKFLLNISQFTTNAYIKPFLHIRYRLYFIKRDTQFEIDEELLEFYGFHHDDSHSWHVF